MKLRLILLMMLVTQVGCFTKDPVSPPPPDGVYLRVEYELEEVQESKLTGNFGCDWCEFAMEEADSLWVVDNLPIQKSFHYLFNIEFLDGRYAAIPDSIVGILRATTSHMDSLVTVDSLQVNEAEAVNFFIQINEDGEIVH